jgi:hypothetical protein
MRAELHSEILKRADCLGNLGVEMQPSKKYGTEAIVSTAMNPRVP